MSMSLFCPHHPPAGSVSPKPPVEKSDVDSLKNLAVATLTSGTSGKQDRFAFQSKFDEVVEDGCVEVSMVWLFFACVRREAVASHLFRSAAAVFLYYCYFVNMLTLRISGTFPHDVGDRLCLFCGDPSRLLRTPYSFALGAALYDELWRQRSFAVRRPPYRSQLFARGVSRNGFWTSEAFRISFVDIAPPPRCWRPFVLVASRDARYLTQGYLMKQSKLTSRWSPGYFRLDDGSLEYYENKSLLGTKPKKVHMYILMEPQAGDAVIVCG